MHESNTTKKGLPATVNEDAVTIPAAGRDAVTIPAAGHDTATIPAPGRDVLTEIPRDGAQRLLAQAIEAEVEVWTERHEKLKDDHGRRQVVRNGHHPTRKLVTGVGPVEVTQPRRPVLEQNAQAIIVRGNDFRWEFDRNTGQIKLAQRAGKTVLVGGPHLMILPLKTSPCVPEHSRKIPPFNDVCTDWQAETVTARQVNNTIEVVVEGRYATAAGRYTMRVDDHGTLAVSYSFKNKHKVNPRQIGLVFKLPRSCETLTWQRDALWLACPDDHIGRPHGTAPALRAADSPPSAARAEPRWSWSLDANTLGTNDFRATRRNIRRVALRTADGDGVRAVSDGRQSARAWLDGERVRLLIAEFNTGGGDLFLNGHYAPERRPLKPGDMVAGEVRLELLDTDSSATDLEKSEARATGIDGRPPAAVRVERQWTDGVRQARLVNTGAEAVRIREIVLCRWVHGLPGATPIYGEGLQMLSQTGGTLAEPVDLGYYTDRGHYKAISPNGARAIVYGLRRRRVEISLYCINPACA